MALQAGTKGKVLGAVIKSIEESKWQKGKHSMKLKLDVENDAIINIKLMDTAGKEITIEPGGATSRRCRRCA